MISKTECRVHHRLDSTVDVILAGKSPLFEIRQMEHEANVPLKSTVMTKIDHRELSDMLVNDEISADVGHGEDDEQSDLLVKEEKSAEVDYGEKDEQSGLLVNEEKWAEVVFGDDDEDYIPKPKKKMRFIRSASKRSSPISVYTYEILEADLLQVATVMGLEDEIDVTDDIGRADAILASTSEIKLNPWIRGIAKFHKLPMFVIKSNTMAQMVKAVRMILERESTVSRSRALKTTSSDIEIEDDAPKRKPTLEEIDALEEVRLAIEYIVIPGVEPVELLPRLSEIIARQLELVKSYYLDAENSGTEHNPRLQILPHRLDKNL